VLPPIRGFIENTLIDWEGKIAAEVFLPGCNFRCGVCHARYLLESSPNDESIPLDAVRSALRRRKGWIDGIVISGGEPTLQPELADLIRLFRQDGLLVKLDTNGSRPEVIERLIAEKLLDYVAMDVKGPLGQRYSEIAGVEVDIDSIRHSIELLISSDIAYEFRTTLCPAQLDPDAVEATALGIRGAALYYLQGFRPLNCLNSELNSVAPYNPDQLRDLCRRCSKYIRQCAVRGDEASTIGASAAK